MNNEIMNTAIETAENTAIVATTQEEVAMNTAIDNAVVNAPQVQDEVVNAPQEEEFTPTEGDEPTEAPGDGNDNTGNAEEYHHLLEKYPYLLDTPLIGASITWTVKQAVKMFANGTIGTENIIQRGYRWEAERRGYLIHSLMYGFPVPVFWANRIERVTDKGKKVNVYDLLDGKQRILSIVKFVNGEYALTNVPPIMIDGVLIILEGKYFADLPEELQDAILSYPLTVKYYDNMTDGQKREMFKRLNNGKPLSSKEVNIANCRNLGTVSDLANHQLFATILTEKAKESRKGVTLVVKAYEMLTNDLATVSFESKNLNPVMESVSFSNAEKEMLNSVLDYALMVYNSFDGSIKGAKKKYTTEVHLISLMPFLKKAKDDGIEPKLVADFVVANYSKRVSISERYTTASRDGSARTASINIRNEEISEAWDKFFTADDEVTVSAPEGNADQHIYGMRLRGFAPGCQPMDGLVEGKDDPAGKYHSILVYDRELSAEEVEEYELDVI